ncbi:hypothetical protein [Arthrobacter sp. MI7-26]|uniref:hypothetical protein n=1 Tax=Arthrobacter sp. MI7-26 TaxID=2993653 RepID=UPI0022498733|nr:hypothetical protein [Arthrobacter sp. MI7-26]
MDERLENVVAARRGDGIVEAWRSVGAVPATHPRELIVPLLGYRIDLCEIRIGTVKRGFPGFSHTPQPGGARMTACLRIREGAVSSIIRSPRSSRGGS